MKLRKYPIRRLLKFTAILVVLSLTVFTAIFFLQQMNAQQNREALLTLEHLYQHNAHLQKNRIDFLFHDMQSTQLYRFGYSRTTIQHDSLIRKTNEEIKKLEKRFGKNQTSSIKAVISEYDKQFKKIKEMVIERGFKDFGLEGQLRDKIHQVEENINQQKDYRLMSHMLMLRRHEKDYMIRRDTSYITKFDKEYQAALNYLSHSYNGKNHETTRLLNDYSRLFHSYTDIDKRIGINENEGTQYQLIRISTEMSEQIDELRTELAEKLKADSQRIYVTMLGLIFITSILLLLILTRIGNHITKTLTSIQKIVNRMGKGEIPQPINIVGKDEFSGIEVSINELSVALQNTRKFAEEVGNGNFYSEVNVFGNTGELGSKLLEMRQRLLEVAEERERNIQENNQRNWLNENIANIGEILRVKYENTTELCFQFIRFSVKQTSSLQGAVYLKKQNPQTGEEYIELTASYAMERRKYLNRTLDIHEGLPGACMYEKDVIFVTDIPKDYTHITTGLGESNPTCIILVPLITDMHEVIGCIEIASYHVITPIEIEFTKKACNNLASAIRFNEMISLNERIISEMKQKNMELLASEEELKQNMEELKTIREDMERREESLTQEIKLLNHKLKDYENDLLLSKISNQ